MKIKVLFIHANNSIPLFQNANKNADESNDYLTDSLFLEMKNRDEFEVFECPPMLHMYKNSVTDIKNITGLGFTIRKKINGVGNCLTMHDTIQKIENKFFDLIFTDSRTMNKWWFERGLSPNFNNSMILKNKILSIYPKEKIIFLDGEDQPNSILSDFYGKSLYFKRELINDDENLLPIGYSFPKKSFKQLNNIDEKIKPLSTIIPGLRQTYIFNDENQYYEDYRKSFFGLTWRKLGWDCFRHHEIIFSSCLPLFPDINDCPKNTLTKFPKNICKEILKLDCLKNINYNKVWLAHDLYYFKDISINIDKININDYNELLEKMLMFSFENNTSEKMLDYILNHTK